MTRLLLVFLLLLSACAPEQQSLRSSVYPEHIAIDRDTMLAADGVILPVKSWVPKGHPKAVIVALHGIDDYSNAFVSRGIFFSAHGVALYAYDQRGFGLAPQTGVWAGEDNLVRDLRECVRQVARRYPRTPLYILGESMGGAVAIVAMAKPDFP